MGGRSRPTPSLAVRIDRRNLGWWLLGVALLVVLARIAGQYLAWLVFGLFVYYVARPVSRRLERVLPWPGLAAAATLALIVLPVLALLALVVVTAFGQLVALVPPEAVQALLDARLAESELDLQDPEAVFEAARQAFEDPSIQALVDALFATVGSLATTAFNAGLSLTFAFFMLYEDRRVFAWFRRRVFGDDSRTVDFFQGLDEGLNSVYFGYTLTILAIVVLTTVIYNLFNVLAPAGLRIPATVLLGVLTGIITLIPLVGRSIVYLGIAVVLGLDAVEIDPFLLWFPAAFYVVMAVGFDNLVRVYIRPYLSGQVYHMGLVMFAFLLGPPLFGWYGIFAGPLLLVVVVTFLQRVLPVLVRGGPEPAPGDRPRPHDRELSEFGGPSTTGGEPAVEPHGGDE